jgi:hypothetical protein
VTHFTEELDFLSAADLEWIMGRGLKQCLRAPPRDRRVRPQALLLGNRFRRRSLISTASIHAIDTNDLTIIA